MESATIMAPHAATAAVGEQMSCTTDFNRVSKVPERKVFVDKNLGGDLKDLCRDHAERKGRDFSYTTGEYSHSCSFFSFVADSEMTQDERTGGVCRKMVPVTQAMAIHDASSCLSDGGADATAAAPEVAAYVAVDAADRCPMPMQYKRSTKGFSDHGGCDGMNEGSYCICSRGSEVHRSVAEGASFAACVREDANASGKATTPATCQDGSAPVPWSRSTVTGWACSKAPGGPKCDWDATNETIQDGMKNFGINPLTGGAAVTSSVACHDACKGDDPNNHGFMFLHQENKCYCALQETSELQKMHPIVRN